MPEGPHITYASPPVSPMQVPLSREAVNRAAAAALVAAVVRAKLMADEEEKEMREQVTKVCLVSLI